MEFWVSEAGRITLLVLASIGFLLQWDNLIESVRAAKKGGDDSSDEEEPSPPVA